MAREALIKLQPGTTIQQLAQAFDVESAQPVGNSGLIRLRSRSLNVSTLVNGATRNPLVTWAEPNYVVRISDTLPNDPNFGALWGLRNTAQAINGQIGLPFADINAVKAWDLTTGSSQILVGIVDTGVDYTHPDLVANIWTASTPYQITLGGTTIICPAGSHGFNAIAMSCDPRDDHYHGTHVAGTIGASGNNLSGVTGVNWTTSIVAFKFLNSSGQGSIADAINAIEAAVQMKAQGINLRVLNSSWGGLAFSDNLLQAINDAHDMLFVAAAGNFATDNDGVTPFYPATYNAPNILAVAATDNQDRLANFSNYGHTTVHLGAPGVDIFSTLPSNSYGNLSGTSMATPHVVGTAALVLSKCSLSMEALRTAILSSIDPIPSLLGKTTTGGRLNAYRTLSYCGASDTPGFFLSASQASISAVIGGSTSTQISVTPQGGFAGEVTFSATGLPAGATALFSPPSWTGSGSSLLTLTTSSTSPAGSYPITIHGISGSLEHTQSLNLTVNAPDFTVSASPGSVTAPVGGSTGSSISVMAQFGFNGVVNLTASGMPAGVSASFLPDSVKGAGGATLTLAATASAVPGIYLITVQGLSGSLGHLATVLLTVTSPDFSVSASPGSFAVATGATSGSTISVSALNGFTGIVNLSAIGLPVGVTASFSPTSVTGAGSSAMTLTASPSTAPGLYPITVQGASGALTRTTTVNLTVAAPLLIGTASLTNAQVGVPYSQTLVASGGVAPYTWTATSGRLPRGLSLSESTGTISGTPFAVATTLLTFLVTDSTTPVTQTATVGLLFTVTDGAMAIVTESLASGQVGTAYSQTLSASGGAGPYTWALSSGALPNGLMLNPNTGQISGTPTTPANSPLTFSVTDSSSPKRSASKVLTLKIASLTLSITTASLPNGQVGAAYSQTLAASGGIGFYTWTVIAGGTLPNGLSLNSSSGQISGTPTASMNTAFTFQVTDTGSPAQIATKVFNLTITTLPLSISTVSLATGQVGAIYSQTLIAAGGTAPYTWAMIAGGALPNGLTLTTSTGQIGGLPTAVANGSYTFQVTDSSLFPQVTTKVLTLTITQSTLAITTATLANGQVGSAYTQTLTASGGAGSYTWDLVGGALPSGLTLNQSTGLISGIPTTPANTSLTFRVTDSGLPAQTATKNLPLTIGAAGLTIATGSLANGQPNVFYAQSLAATGGVAPYAWTTISGRLPRGLTLNESTGMISGTPSAASSTLLTFQVTDSAKPIAKTATANLLLTIGSSGGGFTITTTSLPDGQVGAAYSQTLTAAGGVGSNLWVVISGVLPNGLALNQNTGQISGTPTAAANVSLTFQATDSSSPAQVATKVLTLIVNSGVTSRR